MIDKRFLFAAGVLAIAACSGNFGTGGTSLPGGVNPPLDANTIPAPFASGSPGAQPTALPKGGSIKGNVGTFSLSDASSGFQCPTVNGYSCVLSFNLPTPAPTTNPKSKHSKSKATPAPTPTPTPTPSPTPSPTPAQTPLNAQSGGSFISPQPAAATAVPAPIGDIITLTLEPQPKGAPKMTDPDPTALATTALVEVHLLPSANFVLNGDASIQFSLPAEQIPGRGFAIQIFSDTEGKHHKHTFAPLFATSKSQLDKQTLSFNFTPPSTTLPKGKAYLIVLYGDEKPSATTNPSPAPSSSPAGSPEPSPSAAR